MSGESSNVYGPSGWVTVGTSVSCAAGGYTQISPSNTIASLMAAGEADFSNFEIRLQTATTTPTLGNVLTVLIRQKRDGSNEAPAPKTGFVRTPVSYITLSNALASYYGDARNIDKNGTFYIYSNEASNALTITMQIRMKALKAAA